MKHRDKCSLPSQRSMSMKDHFLLPCDIMQPGRNLQAFLQNPLHPLSVLRQYVTQKTLHFSTRLGGVTSQEKFNLVRRIGLRNLLLLGKSAACTKYRLLFLILRLYFLQFTVSFRVSPILSQHITLNNVEHACISSGIPHVSLQVKS
jgi:hypothetical protein